MTAGVSVRHGRRKGRMSWRARRSYKREVRPQRIGLLLAAAGLSACGDEPAPSVAPTTPVVERPDWAAMDVPTTAQLLGVWGRSASEVYAVGWNGTVLRYDGARWARETTTATVPLTDVAGALLDPDDPLAPAPVFAVGWSGTILVREASGTWTEAPRTSTATEVLFGVHLSGPELGLAVGDRGRVLRWEGQLWSDLDFAVPSELSGTLIRPRTTLVGVYSANGRRWVLTGAGGASFASTDGPEGFTSVDTLEEVALRGAWGPGPGTTYTVGLEGVVLRLTNRWRRERFEFPDTFFFGVWGRGEEDLTVVGWGGQIVRRLDGEWRSERSGSGVDLRDVWVDAETGAAFAVGAGGTILTRTSTAGL